MYSVILLLITLLQIVSVGVSYSLHAQEVFYVLAVYGSPIYLIMNLFTADSAWIAKNPVYLGLLGYHLVKYALFFRARAGEGGGLALTASTLFEAAYLGTGAYFLF